MSEVVANLRLILDPFAAGFAKRVKCTMPNKEPADARKARRLLSLGNGRAAHAIDDA